MRRASRCRSSVPSLSSSSSLAETTISGLLSRRTRLRMALSRLSKSFFVSLRRRGQAELGLDVLLIEQQHAAGGLAVPAGAPGLLQVVLQRARDVGVDHDPDVGLVHPHAEGVRRRDHRQIALDEALLDAPSSSPAPVRHGNSRTPCPRP